ncbi:hypothetical protein [Demequina sp.]|uniref:hypothetical protein n=1 Tax=Demequina sp. TaxID=2050685 RepID=UPI003A88B5A5
MEALQNSVADGVNWAAFPPETKRLIDEDAAAGNIEAIFEAFQVRARGRMNEATPGLLIYMAMAQVEAARTRKRWNHGMTT